MNQFIYYAVTFGFGLLFGLVIALLSNNNVINDLEEENRKLKQELIECKKDQESRMVPPQIIEISDTGINVNDYLKPF